MSKKIHSNPLEGMLWQALKTKLSFVLTRYPAYLFAGMLVCVVISAVWVFSARRADNNMAVFESPRPRYMLLDTLGAKLPSIAETYGALNRVLALQSEIGALIEKDSLSSSDSIALIGALDEFESLQRSMQPKNNLQ
ncbi:hypothetical protein [Sphingobacterium bambusae]|uniref:Polysaccharide chain length determinant N-terminal domain-containing protein n=1 Tax=Sphingobacterium bambusae TaxID=662858 RepID=A0ABW6BDK5_9SPHI|nr:hypothetical protein [Sphingobacterium bambusae]WPL48528.1 hypothetical protein SCB77_21500 [Sphingobacterium bambusae]